MARLSRGGSAQTGVLSAIPENQRQAVLRIAFQTENTRTLQEMVLCAGALFEDK
jgi:hypothetical protein